MLLQIREKLKAPPPRLLRNVNPDFDEFLMNGLLRKFAVIMVGISVLFATGCGSSQSGDVPAQMVLSSISAPKSFNPVTAKETSTTDITGHMFVGLTRQDGETGEVEPELAESWKTREGGRIWEFRLRKGLKWSDGQPLTVEDVVFTYNQLYLNPDVNTSSRFMLLMNGQPPQVTAVDTRTIRFEYPEPYAPFARSAGLPIMPKHIWKPALEAGKVNSFWGVNTDPDSIVVNGPFRLGRYATNERVILRPNPHYYEDGPKGESLPRLNKVLFEIVKNREVSYQKFVKGELDALSIQGTDYPLLKPREQELNFTMHRVGPSLGTTFLAFNMNTDTNPETGESYIPEYKLDWFNDPQFRRAVSYGLDREQLIDIVMNGLGTPLYGPVSPANKPFYNKNLTRYSHDVERAREILKVNGYRDRDGDGIREDTEGNPIEFVLNTNSGNDQRVEMTEIIRQDLANLGFRVNFSQIQFNSLVNKLNSDFNWEAVVIGFTGSIDPHFGSNLWLSSADLHLWHPRQSEPHREWERKIDQIFQEAVKETDPEARRKMYFRWQKIVNEVQPVIYTVTPETIYAIRNKFTNVNPTPIGGFTHNLERIGIKP